MRQVFLFSRERLRGGRPLFGVEKGGKDGRGGISISTG